MQDVFKFSDAPTGVNFTIKNVTGQNCEKLKNHGFCEGINLRKIKDSTNVLCSLCGVKYAISKNLCQDIILNENQ